MYEGNVMEDSVIAVETAGNRVFNKMAAILEDDKNSSSPVFSDFRENFGGGYIEGDHLIIYVKGGISNQGLFEERMLEKGISKDRYDIQTVDYSYSELESQMQSFWDFRNAKMANNVEWAKNIYSLAISQAKNCVKISLSCDLDINDYPELQSFLSEMSYELIYLDEAPKIVEETTSLKPGMPLSTGGSIGFRCKLNGNKGIVTAIHTSSYSSFNPIAIGTSPISFGNITNASYGASSDFCFVKISNADFSAIRKTNTSPSYTLHATHYVTFLPENYVVYLVGKNSSSARQGHVEDFSGTVADHAGSDWLICSYSSSRGDSGGCIFAVVEGDNCIVGIHDGKAGSYKYGTKYTRMKEVYSGLTIY